MITKDPDFLFCIPLLLGNCSLASYFASKILTLKTPLPLGVSDNLQWGGYGCFLEVHNSPNKYHKTFMENRKRICILI